MRSSITVLLRMTLALLAVTFAANASAERLDPGNPDDVIKIQRKWSCSLVDGEPVIYWWYGSMYSRVPGERDRVLFNVQGMNIRTCGTVTDPVRGTGYRSVSREVMFYLDPETDEILRTWENPWTGETNEVIHVANDPVNMRRPVFPYDENGEPAARWRGMVKNGRVFTTGAVPLFYTNPMGGEFQEYVGGSYHAMEMFNSFAYEDEVFDPDIPSNLRKSLGWSRISKWLPWMEMGDRVGMMIATTAGRRMKDFDELPDVVKDEIRLNYPEYTEAPPLDDSRPNDTTWTITKRAIDARRAAEAKEAAE